MILIELYFAWRDGDAMKLNRDGASFIFCTRIFIKFNDRNDEPRRHFLVNKILTNFCQSSKKLQAN